MSGTTFVNFLLQMLQPALDSSHSYIKEAFLRVMISHIGFSISFWFKVQIHYQFKQHTSSVPGSTEVVFLAKVLSHSWRCRTEESIFQPQVVFQIVC
ncbi:uncharacterized protein LOC109832394 isoform X2 [Asparagus officinalis]|uniref:uncharacterized protein LOC109832393 isoform X2 n=1 Tax=Asparagus officinalis TaxID=4686 RepID=UPI00098E0487|nr:uncharacterized protein LOC109832393 isoform X2 [Asparagus officinalis]XP_020255363.1 uncharacterized protein LOC109832394 isoform X2 [Asparagus officinalis]